MQWTTEDRVEAVGALGIHLTALHDFEASTAALFQQVDHTQSRWDLEDLVPMFGVIWPSARAVSRWLTTQPLEGRRVLELGCGLALPSLVAASLGARVLATDQHPETEAFLRRNLARNPGLDVPYQRIDWRSLADLPDEPQDLVIASDVLYTPDLPTALAETLAHLRTRAVVADPGRPWLQDFVSAAQALGLTVTEDVVAAGPDDDPVFLLHVTP